MSAAVGRESVDATNGVDIDGALSLASFDALGTTAVVAVTEPASLPDARPAVETTIEQFDLACSRFRDDSEITALNEAAGTPFRCSPLLLDAVTEAVRAAQLTDGDVDPTVGEALIALGYDRDFAELEPGRRVTFAAVPGWRSVRVDRAAATVSLARGVRLDLGATAKALAADRAVAAALEAVGCGVLVSLGGDLAVAGRPPAGGWRIRVTDDHRAGTDEPGQWITIKSGGLATSSTTTRKWAVEGGFAHHLVDPATGRPVEPVWRTVSVTAASCLDANIAATAAIVRGAGATEWLQSLGLPSRLVSAAGVATHVAGWPTEGDDLG